MAKHHPFWCSCGARSVNDGFGMRVGHLLFNRFHLLQQFRRGQIEHFGVMVCTICLVKHINTPQELCVHAFYFFQKFGITYKNIFSFRLIQDKLQFYGVGGWINWNENGAYLLHGQVGKNPFGPVLANDRDLIASFGC